MTASFTATPTSTTRPFTLNVDGSATTPPAGKTLISHIWYWGDGAESPITTGAPGVTTRAYPSGMRPTGGGGTLTVRLVSRFGTAGTVEGQEETTRAVTLTDYAPPANDNFATPTALTGTTGTLSWSTRDASTETGEPGHPFFTNPEASVWFSYTATAPGNLLIDTSATSFPAVDAFTGTTLLNLVRVAFAWQDLTFPVTAGTTYWIRLESEAAPDNTGTLTWTFTNADTPPTNPTVEPAAPTGPPQISGAVTPPADPPPQAPPAGAPRPTLQRTSLLMPTPILDSRGFPDPDVWLPTSTITGEVGSLQVVVDGVDRTYFRNIPILVGDWDKQQPFGDASGSLRLPQVSIFERAGVGALAWLHPGANVNINVVPTTGPVRPRFEGLIPSFDAIEQANDGELTVSLLGALFQADLATHKPPFHLDPADMGTRVAATLNGVVSRHYQACATVTTGIPTRKRGSMTQTPIDFAQELLGVMTTADGLNQWTVDKLAGRQPILRLKDRTTQHWTVSAGAQGVVLNLTNDHSSAWNVIYGEGIAPDSCVWRNAKWPNLRADTAPAYPYAAAGTTMSIGSTDSGTSSGNGVSTWQREMNQNGYPLPVDGYFGPEDAYQCRRLQKAAGILVDGIVGPQTWAATFEVGSNVGDLNGAYIAPLAIRTQVEPSLYNAQGATIGANPAYDPTVVRVERYVNYGDGVDKRTGMAQAMSELARAADPGWLGTITLTTDPEEGSRFDIDDGQNIYLRYFQGAGQLFHIAGVRADHDAGTVTLTVDTQARDLLAVTAIHQRDKEALTPAFDRLGNRSSSQSRDVAGWDCESGAGIDPRHALFGGLWTVLRIPAGRAGTIARTWFTTTSPASRFAVGIFSKRITANDLAAIVGNPLAATKSWTTQYDALQAFGWLIAWGDAGQAAGYFPGLGSDADPVTGRLVDDALWNYQSDHAPWLWLAEYSTTSCFIEGRLQQQVIPL